MTVLNWEIIAIGMTLISGFIGWVFKTTLGEIKSRLNKLEDKEYVHKEDFYAAIAELKGLFTTVFEEQRQVSKTLNQTIGRLNQALETYKK